MVKFIEHIEKYIIGKNVLVLFLLTNIVYAYMLLVTIPATMEFSNGLQLLDMMPAGYHLEYVNNLFSTLGDNGRQTYLTTQIPVDMIYPFLFGISYAAVLAYFLKKLHKLNTTYLYLCLLPIIAGIADYIENIGIISMLNKYPNVTETTANITSTFSVIKSVSTSIYFLALLVVLFVLSIEWFKKSRRTH
ncbi:hypothetical protein [Maribacter hydrothermalis]|uniref:Uncharacterized protein n=1 Tax=Maribacter hydrothermalis TaxID=1836467 RepID=A0A1B7Z8C1_9FLAO|nr:hypothetical protein [Maribacter hydrothermalis]APQ19044.1 hypothetical protein BTR34_17715 [Maribacter hydrothermalis]OBR38943.1 hypothetical protein A9200_04565 [Maribacter hydrothermalis]